MDRNARSPLAFDKLVNRVARRYLKALNDGYFGKDDTTDDFSTYGGDFAKYPVETNTSTPGYWGDEGDEQLSVTPYRGDLDNKK
jgi:hypothetical protein